MKAPLLSVIVLTSSAHAFLGGIRPGPPRTSPISNSAVKPTDKPPLARAAVPTPGPLLPQHVLVPAVSYAGLGFTAAGALKLISAAVGGSVWLPVGIICWTVGMPVIILSARLATVGGKGVAESMGGEPADARLTALAREAAEAVGIPPPAHVMLIPRQEPNAFAASDLTGGPHSTTVAVTSGLRNLLTENELSAVLAHEMGHLRHKDVASNMHVAIAVAGLGGIYESGRLLLESSSRSKTKEKDKDEGGSAAGLGLGLMGVGLASQGVGHLLGLAAGRGAELKADRAAAEAFGAQTMVSALQKIEAAASKRPADLSESREARSMAFAMISDSAEVAKRSAWPKWSKNLLGLLRTHPTIEQRVAALERAADDGHVPQSAPSKSWSSTWM